MRMVWVRRASKRNCQSWSGSTPEKSRPASANCQLPPYANTSPCLKPLDALKHSNTEVHTSVKIRASSNHFQHLTPECGWVIFLATEKGAAKRRYSVLGLYLHSKVRNPSTCIGESAHIHNLLVGCVRTSHYPCHPEPARWSSLGFPGRVCQVNRPAGQFVLGLEALTVGLCVEVFRESENTRKVSCLLGPATNT